MGAPGGCEAPAGNPPEFVESIPAINSEEGCGMAVWKCSACGHEKEGRCKPRKCPECGGSETFSKKD